MALDQIEAAADALFDGVVGLPASPPERAAALAARGFALVAVDADERILGFAHVLEFDARFHLEQLSVHPDAQRQGLGAALLAAAEDGVRARGASVVTLRTFADVPWNAPFYRRHGYVDAELPVALTRCWRLRSGSGCCGRGAGDAGQTGRRARRATAGGERAAAA